MTLRGAILVGMNPDLAHVLQHNGVIARREHPGLHRAIDAALRAGTVCRVMRGVYMSATITPDWRSLALAACRYADDAVITGDAALAISFNRAPKNGRVEACRVRPVTAKSLITWHMRQVPARWILQRGGLRYAHPAWAAVELAGRGDAAPLDEALREGVALQTLWEAYRDMANRNGNPIRRRLLIDSRDEPWSPAERLAHQLLRKAGIAHWVTNHPVGGYRLDIAWRGLKVYLEVDGYEFHSDRSSFEADRLRDQILMSQGWMAVHVTYRQLVDDATGVMRRLKQVLVRRARTPDYLADAA